MKIIKHFGKIVQTIRNEMASTKLPLIKETVGTPSFNEDILEEDELDDLEFDTDDTIVQPLDGIMIWGDDEEVRLLCFYYKPHIEKQENEKTRCKLICELRTSRSTFLDFTKYINETAKDLKKRKFEPYKEIQQEKYPMFA